MHVSDIDLFWQFRCFDCKEPCLGVLIMLPKGSTSLGALDEDKRRRRRDQQGIIRGRRRSIIQRSRYISSDTLRISVKVIKGRRRGDPTTHHDPVAHRAVTDE